MEKKKNRKKPWRRWQHGPVQLLLRLLLRPVIVLRYRIRIDRFRDRRQVLVLTNHQTAFDQFFISLSLRRTVYYLASEDLFTKGWLSRLIAWLAAPIPIRKSMTDVRAVVTAMRVSREGGTIALAPEGNRTYSGATGDMKESVAPFVRSLGLPLALFRIEGGYGVHPRWSDAVRRGRMRAGVRRVIEPSEIAAMTDAELFALISRELFVDESAPSEEVFRHPRRAEYMERALYYCPDCGMTRLVSEGAYITCTSCRRRVEYSENKELRGVDRPFPYRSVGEWYRAQSSAMRELDLSPYGDTPLFEDTVMLFEEIPYKKKLRLGAGVLFSAYADRYELRTEGETLVFFYEELSATSVLGRNKLNLYKGSRIFQIKGDKRFCALRYMNLYYRVKNEREGNRYAEFLGI